MKFLISLSPTLAASVKATTSWAIGNTWRRPCFFSVTRHRQCLGTFPQRRSGTWIQTDTPINPGNMAVRCSYSRRVIGINHTKTIRKIHRHRLRLSATDLLDVLHRFYPNAVPLKEKPLSSRSIRGIRRRSAAGRKLRHSRIERTQGAEIWLDHAFVGNVPAKLKLKRCSI